MNKPLVCAAFAALALLPRGVDAQSSFLRVQVRAQVVVADAEAAARELAAWSEQAGGHFLLWSRDRVVLRVPAARVEDLRTRLLERAEAVLSYTPSAADLREEMARVEAGITSREESLRLVLSYVDDADVTATLALEKEIAVLVQALEQLKGTRTRLAYDAAYARAEIQLRSQAQTVPRRRPSSFGWINTVDMYRFVEESHGR
jgi:hypothetical protein